MPFLLVGSYGAYENEYQRVVAAFSTEEAALEYQGQIEAAIQAGPWHHVIGRGMVCEAAQLLDCSARNDGDCSYEVEWCDLDP